MASTAARAARLALAVQAVEDAMTGIAEARGIEAPPLPVGRDPAITQAMRLEGVAAFLRSLAELEKEPPEKSALPEKKRGKGGTG